MSGVPKRVQHLYSEEEWNRVLQMVRENKSEFIQEFQKSVLTIDNHRDELTLLPTKEDRVKRIREILQGDK